MIESDKKPPAASVTVQHAHQLFRRGVYVSLAYIGGLSIYAWFVRDAMLKMEPDEFATFLSGVFAPLAFLWLVLGFRQQGDELQNSARALWLQGEELRNSVEQQRQLVQVSREQLEAEAADRKRAEEDEDRAAQPQLILASNGSIYSGGILDLEYVVCSPGPVCSDVHVLVDGSLVRRSEVFAESDRIDFQITFGPKDEVKPANVTVSYTDRRGNRRAQAFYVPVVEGGSTHHGMTLGHPAKLPRIEKVS